ncbi:ATP-binding cassette domain-containing protein [Nonomuraea sp. SBT364]|uniref:ATP-binding cassette domain-containing protein n=1 Tax=Nonomuraea sp. SBT364 TaxID=1580530 RepID=UPI00066C09AE|nr:ATP-binding cassette domain-containing protein [Nonomuraea sp. SBT364]
MLAIRAEGLHKAFGPAVALDGLDLEVPEGSITALLGPNGAGKTTLIRILATLSRPGRGRAEVCGFDVTARPDRVRALIGLTGQYAAVDELLTGRENLVLIGRLARMGAAAARVRARELMELFELEDRRAGTYSGGTRRRLDLAASLMARPRVLFYLEEADRLAGAVTLIDRGRVVTTGTPAELKSRAGGPRAEVVLADPAQAGQAITALARYGEPGVRDATVTVPVAEGALPGLLRELDAAGVGVAELALRRPTLDDAFLALTGHAPQDGDGR